MMDEFFFHRPWWLLAILPLIVLVFWLKKRQSRQSNWEKHIDAHLLPHILTVNGGGRKKNSLPFLAFSWLLMVFVLAGPNWKKTPPVILQADVPALFILLDLSRSMLTRDIFPDRLTVAKAKIRQLLQQISPRPITLITYSAIAHQVIPLTEDRRLISNVLEYLQPDLMPAHGSNSSAALLKSREIIRQLAIPKAELVLVGDSIDEYSLSEGERITQLNGRIHVYAVATKNGAYIPGTARGYLHIDGQPIHSALQREDLRALAEIGQGHYQEVSDNEQDIINLSKEFDQFKQGHVDAQKQHRQGRVWQDQAAWLLLLLLPLAWLLFQPGLYAILLPALLLKLQLYSPPVMADWQKFWKNTDQLAMQAIQNQHYEKAEQLFDNPLWRGIAQYRQKKFQQALNSFSKVQSAEGFFNRGNALFQLGRYQEALSSYRTAVKKNPGFKPARHNLQRLEKALQDAQADDSDLSQIEGQKQETKKRPKKKRLKEDVVIPEVAEDLLDSPTEQDLKEKKEQRDLNLENIVSQSGGAMLVHDIEKDRSKQGGSIGQGLGEGTQELQQQEQLARQGQGQSTSKQGHEAKRIVANKSVSKKSTEKAQTGEQTTKTATSKKVQNPGLIEAADSDAIQENKPMSKAEQQKSTDKGGSGANTKLSHEHEQRQFLKNWLKSIEDNPSELLKEIFKRDYESRHKNKTVSETLLKSEQGLKPW